MKDSLSYALLKLLRRALSCDKKSFAAFHVNGVLTLANDGTRAQQRFIVDSRMDFIGTYNWQLKPQDALDDLREWFE